MSSCEECQSVAAEAFARAERFLPDTAPNLVAHDQVQPEWMNDGNRFWYRDRTLDGHGFKLVDPCAGTVESAFDHERLAVQLSQVTDEFFTAVDLPFDTFDFNSEQGAIEFEVNGTRWCCDLKTYACTRVDCVSKEDGEEILSPDEQWAVGLEEHNLYVRNMNSDEKIQITQDGEENTAYATPLPSPIVVAGLDEQGGFEEPDVQWSPDSSRFVTYQIDQQSAETLELVQSVPTDGTMRPRIYSYVYPLPGDENTAMSSYYIFDAQTGKKTEINLPPAPSVYYGPPRMQTLWWSNDGKQLYALRRERGYQSVRLFRVDPDTGDGQLLVEETADTGIDVGPGYGQGGVDVKEWMVLEDTSEVLWYSYRDGWGHLYLYDSCSGELKRQVTAGSWVVREIHHIDEQERMVYFTASGREPGKDPYYRHLYRISLDGGREELLTPEDADHEINVSPSGECYVDTYSRVDLAPVSVFRQVDGSSEQVLEEADISRLKSMGWRPPVRFMAKARDGKTDIYGVMIFPTDFDEEKTYPVIDGIYAGPHTNRAPVRFAGGERGPQFWQDQALAELGFIVVNVDGLGMPYRSNRYRSFSYRNLADAGLADHIAAMHQLKDQYPCLDLDRVGIYGGSAGGYSSTQALLAYPDFYKVAVSWAGNHDHRMDKATWVERYMGLPVGDHYDEQSNVTMAKNLKGKLLLMHGDMDENVHIASTLKVVDALVKANKDFDLFILPNGIHRSGSDPYITRKRWEYFVRHLQDRTPPKEYKFRTFSQNPW